MVTVTAPVTVTVTVTAPVTPSARTRGPNSCLRLRPPGRAHHSGSCRTVLLELSLRWRVAETLQTPGERGLKLQPGEGGDFKLKPKRRRKGL